MRLRVETFPVIDLSFAVRTFAVGPIEPLLEDGTIVFVRVSQCFEKHFVIFFRAVGRCVAVPGGDVDTELHPSPLARLRQLLQHIAFAVASRALAHRMPTLRIRPQAKAVVVLCGKDNTLKTSVLGHGNPLVAVEGCGIEDILSF